VHSDSRDFSLFSQATASIPQSPDSEVEDEKRHEEEWKAESGKNGIEISARGEKRR
jgi:hypothetical protein